MKLALAIRNFTFFAGLVGSVTALIIACGSSQDSTFNSSSSGTSGTGGLDSGSFQSSSGDPAGPDANLLLNDPFPPWCGPDGGAPAPPPPTGTEACPDDKNLPGCACAKAGATAACWTGLRKQRGLGVCKDGTTTCVAKNENELEWGACNGEVLPTAGATKGAAACGCFSAGQWNIANLSPCTLKSCTGATCETNAVSTVTDANGLASCPTTNPPTAPPPTDWSTDTLKIDCAGHFKLCLRIRSGVFETPNDTTDCILGEVCTESDYTTANVVQKWPDLPAWLGKDQACAQKWNETPDDQSAGYAEMVVKGTSVRCDAIDDGSGGDLIFNRVKYCPRQCNDPANSASPACVSCQQSGSGNF